MAHRPSQPPVSRSFPPGGRLSARALSEGPHATRVLSEGRLATRVMSDGLLSARALFSGFLCLFLAGCGWGEGARTLVAVDGSSTVYPIAEAISEEFQMANPRVMVTVGRSGSGGGFERFCRGETDISTASRRITPQEVADCTERGIEYLELPIALDGLSVIVNRQNDFVSCLTTEELRRIWRAGSRVRTWRDVRPEFPGAEIQLYGPGAASGTYDTFTEAIVGEVGASRVDFQASEDDNVLIQGITGDRYALGFLGYAYLDRNRDHLRVVAVDAGQGCVQPTPETIRDGRYAPLRRPLFLYPRRSSLQAPGIRDFLRFFMAHAQEVIPETGFVTLPDSVYEANLRALAAPEQYLPGEDLSEGGSPGENPLGRGLAAGEEPGGEGGEW